MSEVLDPAIAKLLRSFMEERIPFNTWLGIQATELSWGFARLELPFRDELVGDPMRPALHGGVLSTLIDTAGGAAAFTQVKVPGDTLSTLDLRIDYLRPGELKTLAAEGSVVRMGNRVASVNIRCFHPDEPDKDIATGKGVYSVRRAT